MTKTFNSCAIVGVLLAFSAFPAAGTTFDVNQTISTGTVTGTITTDGFIGSLVETDIISWNLLLSFSNGSTTLTPGGGSNVGIRGPDFSDISTTSNSLVTATATELLFNFDGPGNGYLIFQQGTPGGGGSGWCNTSIGPACYQGKTISVTTAADYVVESATGDQVIGVLDPNSNTPLPAALPLFATGLCAMGLLGWRRKRKAAAAVAT